MQTQIVFPENIYIYDTVNCQNIVKRNRRDYNVEKERKK